MTKEKKIILTARQLNEVYKRINEETTMTIGVKARDNNASEFGNAISRPDTISDIQKAKSVGDVDVTVSSPQSNDSQPNLSVDVPAGQSPSKALTDLGADANTMIQNGSKVTFTGDGVGVSEGRVYTKKMVEEARLKKMYEEGRKYTKKSLNEEFLLEGEIEDKIEASTISTVFKAFEAVGGNPQDLSTEWDIVPPIIEKYKMATPEQQNLFMSILNNGK